MDSAAWFFDGTVGRRDDTLHRDGIADRVLMALERSSLSGESTVIGLVGPWGSGKSSVLRMIHENLNKKRTWLWVDFNPWLYSGESDMQFGFFNELRGQLQSIEDPRVKKILKNHRAQFNATMQLTAPWLSAVSGLFHVDAGVAARSLGELVAGKRTITRALREVGEALKQIGRPIVVVLDDLDRLDPEELLLVAKLVRLVGRLAHVQYVLSYDEQTLIDLLRKSAVIGDRPGRAGDYLEKIIQFRFDMPPMRPRQVDDWVNDGLATILDGLDAPLDSDSLARFQEIYDGALRDRFRTPRGISRFLAQVEIIDPGVLRELNVVDYLLMTWLRVEEPAVYHWLSRNRDYLLNTMKEVINASADKEGVAKQRQDKLLGVETNCDVEPEHLSGVLRVLIGLFPVLRFDRDGSPRQHVAVPGRLRVCQADYFDRYFALEVPLEDVADVDVAAGVEAMVRGRGDDSSATRLRDAFAKDSGLVRRKLVITQDNASTVIRWMADENRKDTSSTRWIGGPGLDAQEIIARALPVVPVNHLRDVLTGLAADRFGLEVLAQSSRDLFRSDFPPEGVTLEQVKQFRDVAKDLLPQLLREGLDRDDRDPIGGSSGLWVQIWAWEMLDAESVREWIRQRIESGRWKLIRAVAALTEMGVSSNGVRSVLGGISHQQLIRYFDMAWLLQRPEVRSLDPDDMSSPLSDAGLHAEATDELLEAIAEATLRSLVHEQQWLDDNQV